MEGVRTAPATRSNRSRLIGPAVVVAATMLVIAGLWSTDDIGPSVSGRATTMAVGSTAEIVEVVDGDTVRVRIGPLIETVRLLGIDTPESVHPTVPEQCYGAEASTELARLLPPGTIVDLYRDRQARDHYGRLLLYLYRHHDGLAVNLHLLDQGFAAASFYEPNVHFRSRYLGAERRAREDGLGLWSDCEGPDQPLE